MTSIKYDPNNLRLHGDRNKRIIRKSLSECGAGRSILLDNDDCIIAGNGVYEQAQQLGLPVRIVETRGEELIAIKRTDLSIGDERRKALALADNHSSDTSFFDEALVADIFSIDELNAWEFSINMEELGVDALGELENGAFVSHVKNAADIFSVTFTLPKSVQANYDAYVKAKGKDSLTQLIISELCQYAEAK